MRKTFAALAIAAGMLAAAPLAWAEPAVRVAIHLDEGDPAKMNLVLNNAQNIESHYKSMGQEAEIVIVAYGPGLTMLRADKSPVADRIKVMELESPSIHLQACGNTLAKVTEKEGGVTPPLIEGVEVVPSGAVRLIELQSQGYAYLRP